MQLALEKIHRETDGTIKQLMLASLCTQLFEKHGIELKLKWIGLKCVGYRPRLPMQTGPT